VDLILYRLNLHYLQHTVTFPPLIKMTIETQVIRRIISELNILFTFNISKKEILLIVERVTTYE